MTSTDQNEFVFLPPSLYAIARPITNDVFVFATAAETLENDSPGQTAVVGREEDAGSTTTEEIETSSSSDSSSSDDSTSEESTLDSVSTEEEESEETILASAAAAEEEEVEAAEAEEAEEAEEEEPAESPATALTVEDVMQNYVSSVNMNILRGIPYERDAVIENALIEAGYQRVNTSSGHPPRIRGIWARGTLDVVEALAGAGVFGVEEAEARADLLDEINAILGSGEGANPDISGNVTAIDPDSESGEAVMPESNIEDQPVAAANEPPKEYNCCICWGDLNMKNCVSTLCDHYYCKKCFYRWIEVRATCALCRAPIDSKTHLTAEQFERESTECYHEYEELLRTNTKITSKNFKLLTKKTDLEKNVTELFHQQIRLKEMVDNTRGYNKGYMAARDKVMGGLGRKDPRWVGCFGENQWTWGFNSGYFAGKRELHMEMKTIKRNRKCRSGFIPQSRRRKFCKKKVDSNEIDDITESLKNMQVIH